MAVKPRWQRIGLARAAFSSIYENAVASTSNEIMRETKGKPARKRKQRAIDGLPRCGSCASETRRITPPIQSRYVHRVVPPFSSNDP